MLKTKNILSILLTIMMFVPVLFIAQNSISIDTWFLIKYGEHITQNGFPYTEFLSMHENFNFVMQQWLSSYFIYIFYKIFGITGAIIYVYIFYTLIIFVLHKTCLLICDDYNSSCIFTLIGGIILLIFSEARPQMISLLCIILVIYLLEKYIKTNKIFYLFFIPLVMLLQINSHMSMYPCIFMAIFPYLIRCKMFIGNFIEENLEFKKMPIIISLFFSIITLFINPYGINGILYIFNSMSPLLSSFSFEMQNASISNYGGQIIIIIAIILFVIILIYKNKFTLRHLVLFIGALFLTLLSIRNTILLVVALPVFLSSYLKNLENKDKIIKSLFGYYKITLPVIIVLIIAFRLFNLSDYKVTNISLRNDTYENEHRVEDVVDYLLKYDEIEVTCYNEPFIGAYLEYKEIKPYIDSRSEVYLKKNNGKEDILNEYLLLQYGRINKDEFIKKYNFDYFLVKEDDILYSYLLENNYKLLYNNDIYYLFENN